MKKSSLIEYTTYLLIRFLGIIVISLPPKVNFTLGKIIGILGYLLLKKKRNLALKNLKIAFQGRLTYQELEKIVLNTFISFSLTIIETMYIPKIDSRYINRHVQIENLKYLDEALKRGKGAILLAYHLGNWELANITCGLQGYVYKVIVNEQRYPLLNNLLNRYRASKGCKVIARGVALREIIEALERNEVVAMVGDQGAKEGHLSKLFGLPVSTPSGFARFSLHTGAQVIPAIIVRERRFYHRIILEPPLKIESAPGLKENLDDYLTQSNSVLEYYLWRYPQEYFWFYKVWKYSPVKSVIVLSDVKAGHLRQAQAVLKTVTGYPDASVGAGRLPRRFGRGRQVTGKIIDIRFKNRFAKALAQVCLALDINILEFCLRRESYLDLKNTYADLVISCGSSMAGINLAFAKENLAKSVCVMAPAAGLLKRFDLVIAPRHDNPPRGKNIAVTSGALNLINEDYLRLEAEKLKSAIEGAGIRACLGILVGGDTKKYALTTGIMRNVIAQVKMASLDLDMDILLTTSRRTPKRIEKLIKEELKDFKRCKLLVIANERNIPQVIGGILGLADFILVSGESISMVSEAASSGKYVGVFKLRLKSIAIKNRHELFLKNLEKEGYISIISPEDIAEKAKDILRTTPAVKRLDDMQIVQERIRKLL
jgi:KDO2-lipid IV(A) lauroyltransferase